MKLTYEASWPDHHVAHPEALRDCAPASKSVYTNNSNPYKTGNMRSAQPNKQVDRPQPNNENQTTNKDKLSTQLNKQRQTVTTTKSHHITQKKHKDPHTSQTHNKTDNLTKIESWVLHDY